MYHKSGLRLMVFYLYYTLYSRLNSIFFIQMALTNIHLTVTANGNETSLPAES